MTEDYYYYLSISVSLCLNSPQEIPDQVRDEGIKSAMRLYLTARCSSHCQFSTFASMLLADAKAPKGRQSIGGGVNPRWGYSPNI